MGDVLDRMGAGNGGLDDFHGSGGEVVLRAKSNDGAAGVEDVADQLEGGGAHGAVGIEAQGDVVDVVATEERFGHHELFVLAPMETHGNFGLGGFAR